MRVKIGNKVYDTAQAVEVGRQTVSFFGDPYGFEEIMFCKETRTGREYFLLAEGGELSQYQGRQIIPLKLSDAREWLERITGTEHANYLIPLDSIEAESKPKASKRSPKPKAEATTKPAKAPRRKATEA